MVGWGGGVSGVNGINGTNLDDNELYILSIVCVGCQMFAGDVEGSEHHAASPPLGL